MTEENGKVILHFSRLFASSYSWSVVLLALVSVLYISAMFLSYYANKAQDYEAFEIVRSYAPAGARQQSCAVYLFFSLFAGTIRSIFKLCLICLGCSASLLCFLAAVYRCLNEKALAGHLYLLCCNSPLPSSDMGLPTCRIFFIRSLPFTKISRTMLWLSR